MNNLKMHTQNKVGNNIDTIAKLFPNTLTETIKGYKEDGSAIIEKAIDFDMLKQELSSVVVEGNEERYQFTWPDKKKSILLANSPVAKTLRPVRSESVDFDTTENLYIEGDNLDVLKMLQETYLNKVKMIYIDPPYNTGKDFVYSDNFNIDAEDYMANSGQYDEEGNRLVQNTESNGRFHTDWLNMIYPRLKLAKDLLTDDGVIFISIDDNEVENLKKICNEIFGESNFVAEFIWKSKLGKVGTTSTISTTHEYILCYGKKINNLTFNMIKTNNNGRRESLRQWGQADRREDRPSMYYPIILNNIEVYPIKEDGTDGRWRIGKEMAKQLLTQGMLELVEKDGRYNIYRNFEAGESVIPYDTLLLNEIGTTAKGSIALKDLDLNKIFDYSKPVDLIKFFADLCISDNEIILDFFSGSATTAHAVMQLNAEDGGNRKFIMVQLPEETDEKSEAYKAGYKNICEIGKERIRRAGKKIISECEGVQGGDRKAPLDIGFRVLKADSTNMKDVFYNPAEYTQEMLDGITDNIKEDRTPEDLLFQVMLDLGVLLSSKIEEKIVCGKKIFNVADNYLLACFDNNITEEVVTAIAKERPYYAVFRDSSIATDSVATNFEQIFESYHNIDGKQIIRKVL